MAKADRETFLGQQLVPGDARLKTPLGTQRSRGDAPYEQYRSGREDLIPTSPPFVRGRNTNKNRTGEG